MPAFFRADLCASAPQLLANQKLLKYRALLVRIGRKAMVDGKSPQGLIYQF